MTALANTGFVRSLKTCKGTIADIWVAALLFMAIFAPLLASYEYDVQNLKGAFAPPSAEHWLGTDEFGRDLLNRIMYGSRTSLSVSAIAIGISVLAAMILGASAGFFGGRFDRAVTVVVDLKCSFPEILVALILVAIIGPGVTGTMVAIGVAYLA
jgi:peptide/nickel transport system permease protein